MRTIVALEKRFDRTPDGQVWAQGWLSYSFWQRYLEVFDAVRVVARVRDVESPPRGALRADGPQVHFFPVPYYQGPSQFARKYTAIGRTIRQSLAPTDAVILRLPGRIGAFFRRPLQAACRPYAVEVVGDPYDVFAPGAVRSVLRPILRWWTPRNLRRLCADASVAAYVTIGALQERYPPAANVFTTSYSSIDMPNEAYVAQPRSIGPMGTTFNVLTVGSMEHLYKGPDVLIEAVAIVVHRGLDVRLTLVGDGIHRKELETMAKDRGLGDRVRFVGHLPEGSAVRAELDQADLFVLPSRAEGLPRAVIEAMARALPCLAGNVGGIPELLEPDELVPPGDAHALADRIRQSMTHPAEWAQRSARNLARAHEFHVDILRPRRRTFYEHVRDVTLAWQERFKTGD